MMDEDEIVKEFLVESHENLDQLDQDLVALETDPTNPEMISRIFRTIHTIKGTCGFLGFTKLEWVTHVGENLLSRIRDGQLKLDAEITSGLLSLVDAVREILSNIETSNHEGDTDYESLVATLTRLQEAAEPVTGGKGPAVADTPTADVSQQTDPDPTSEPSDSQVSMEAGGEHSDVVVDGRLEQFLIDSYQHADQLDQDLVSLETDPMNRQLLSRIFATVYTLKSLSAALGFTATEAAAGAAENLISRLRNGTCELSTDVTTALLSLVDTLRQALIAIETTGNEEEVDYGALIATFERLQDASSAGAEETPKVKPSERKETADQDEALSPAATRTAIEAQAGPPAGGSESALLPGVTETPKPQDAPSGQAVRSGSVADTSIRVDVGLLDMLMDQVGELVLARNRIMQFATGQEDRSVIAAYQRLDLITSELQEGVMKTRMQPIGTIWNKFPRVVRDLARDCGKKVSLSMEGEETELDRTLIEAIRDPLTHLVRNAVDHGIETPEERRRAGKSETGNLFLRAFHEGGQVNIGITDDGGGIDPERIVNRAMERKLITAGQSAEMSDREILDLIFAPGFSTAQKVTNVSGRGVGMDVVKTNIEKINGTIDVQSEVGKGSTIRIKIPLTLAIIPALIVRCEGDRFAIPQASLIELVRLEGDDAREKIETIQGAPVYRLRGKLLPLVYLGAEIADDNGMSKPPTQDANRVVNIVVLQADHRRFGLIVDHVLDTEEIVVKPLGKQVKDTVIFAGATIMGDGNVALILDVLGLAQRGNVVSERREELPANTSEGDEQRTAGHRTLLLFESTGRQRMALPLERVTRLEKFSRADVERSGHCEVVQYWGHVMPLIHISSAFSDGGMDRSLTGDLDASEPSTLEVVVLTLQARSIGLVVDRILDTVEGTFDVQAVSRRQGVLGTVVVQQRVTELLDLDEIIRIADPKLFGPIPSAEVGG